MEGFYAKYRCVKAIELVSVGNEGTLFAGRRVVQCRDYYATVSMDEYIKAKLRPIEVPKGYLSNTKEISEGMLTNIKGVNGGLGWLASTGRPDMAATHSIWKKKKITAVDLRSERGSETVPCGYDHHRDLVNPH